LEEEVIAPEPRARYQLLRRARRLYIVARLLHSAGTYVRYHFGRIDSKSGTLHAGLPTLDSVKYINEVVEDYKTYGRFQEVTGKVAEVGPGDNAGVALMLRALGASEVDLVDRFYARRNETHQAAIYQALMDSHPRIAEMLQGSSLQDERTFPGLYRWYGPEAAAERFFRDHRGYALIVSRAVLEHCADPLGALRDMSEALAPGGVMLHKVDLRDHSLFSPPHSELEWLTTPKIIHRWMTESGGLPNRVLFHRYANFIEKMVYPHEILVTAMAGSGELLPHQHPESISTECMARGTQEVGKVRSRLAREFRNCTDFELSVTGVFIVARKPL